MINTPQEQEGLQTLKQLFEHTLLDGSTVDDQLVSAKDVWQFIESNASTWVRIEKQAARYDEQMRLRLELRDESAVLVYTDWQGLRESRQLRLVWLDGTPDEPKLWLEVLKKIYASYAAQRKRNNLTEDAS